MKKKFNITKFFIYLSAILTFGSLIFIVGHVVVRGISHLKPSLFALKFTTENVSMLPSIINTLQIIAITLLISVPIGVFSAIYMVEYAKPNNKFIKFVRLNTETLQGIPSIVFGLFGMLFFGQVLGLGFSILSGSLTMAMMVLPLIIRATEEALMAVPMTYREASFGLGARKLRTIFNVILPSAMNGLISGIILAIGRVFGETAALLYTAGTGLGIARATDSGRSLAIHMYLLQAEALHINEAYATAFVLIIVVLIINGISALLAKKVGKEQ